MHHFRIMGLCTLALIASGCGEQTKILETFSFEDGRSITTGARQRAITNVRVTKDSIPGRVRPERVICAEPTPEVSVALANSVGLSASVFGKGSASLTGTQAESLLQLAERTATIQMMRDQMYRACEAYSNGAISGTTYSLIMSRINDTMVTLMLAETAAGKVGRSLGALGTSASAEAKASLFQVTDSANKTKDNVAKLAEANKKLDAAEEKASIERAEAERQKEASKDEPATDLAAVAAKNQEKKAVAAETEASRLRGERDALLQLAQSSATAASKAASSAEKITHAGGISAKPSDAVAGVLGGMQSSFLNDDNLKAITAACLVELGNQALLEPDQTPKSRVISTRTKSETKTNTAPAAQPRAARQIPTENASDDSTTDLYRTMLANWRNRSKNAAANPKDKALQDQAYFALSRLLAYERRIEKTELTELCKTQLITTLVKRNDERRALEGRTLQIKFQAERNRGLQLISGLFEKCERIGGGDKAKNACKINVTAMMQGPSTTVTDPVRSAAAKSRVKIAKKRAPVPVSTRPSQ